MSPESATDRRVVNSVAERGLDGAVIDQERSDLDAVLVVNDSLLYIARNHFDAFCRHLLVQVASNVNIEGEGLLEMAHHLCRSGGPETSNGTSRSEVQTTGEAGTQADRQCDLSGGV